MHQQIEARLERLSRRFAREVAGEIREVLLETIGNVPVTAPRPLDRLRMRRARMRLRLAGRTERDVTRALPPMTREALRTSPLVQKLREREATRATNRRAHRVRAVLASLKRRQMPDEQPPRVIPRLAFQSCKAPGCKRAALFGDVCVDHKGQRSKIKSKKLKLQVKGLNQAKKERK
jgi:hypothetical protein